MAIHEESFTIKSTVRLTVHEMGKQFAWHLSMKDIDGCITHTPQRLAFSREQAVADAKAALKQIVASNH